MATTVQQAMTKRRRIAKPIATIKNIAKCVALSSESKETRHHEDERNAQSITPRSIATARIKVAMAPTQNCSFCEPLQKEQMFF